MNITLSPPGKHCSYNVMTSSKTQESPASSTSTCAILTQTGVPDQATPRRLTLDSTTSSSGLTRHSMHRLTFQTLATWQSALEPSLPLQLPHYVQHRLAMDTTTGT